MLDLVTATVIAATFLLAGIVKGVIGLGLPTVSLGLLTIAFDLTSAMGLLIVPSFVTNCWQSLVGGHGAAIVRRTWSFLLTATATIWIGAMALSRVELPLLSGLLGALLVAYSALNLAGVRPGIPRHRELLLGPVLGAANGLLTGMTGSFVVPGVLFLQAIGLPRDALVQAMGILFTLSTVALALALGGNGLLTPKLALVSIAAVLPAALGMLFGQRIRQKLPEDRFRQFFFIGILVLGGYIILNTLPGLERTP